MVWSSPELRAQNHAEFVSIQTVNALAHNAHVAVGKVDARRPLLEILGLDQVCPTNVLRSVLVLQDEVCPGCLSGRAYR